jgi:transcriptional regulator with XRE-family HTH domain
LTMSQVWLISAGPVIDSNCGVAEPVQNRSVINLKKQLKLYLETEDLSAAKLAKRSGVSKQVLSLWLSGGSPKNIEQVKKVAQVFGISVDHLCFGDGIADRRATFESAPEGEWLGGIFEVKFRRLKR